MTRWAAVGPPQTINASRRPTRVQSSPSFGRCGERIDEQHADQGMEEASAPQRRAAKASDRRSPEDEASREYIIKRKPISRGEASFGLQLIAGKKRGDAKR